ncbi:MAG: response regulator transcription factor [Clostridia bacterium]|nr:response regulator transcription factor [Clostridia bacterium]
MGTEQEEKSHFLEYIHLLKEEFTLIKKRYPELASLSHREFELFLLLLTDKTQTLIAQELNISSSAVHFHTQNIYKKLEINNRKQLLIKYKDI